MELQRARDWSDLLLKLLTIVAIVVGGVWAYYQFRMFDTDASNIELKVSTESLFYSDELRLLIVHIKPKNIGKVLVELPKTGFLVTVKTIPKGTKVGALALDALPKFFEEDLMSRFSEGYELEPGVEYDELVVLIVPKDSLFAINTVFNLGEKDEIDQTAIVRSN